VEILGRLGDLGRLGQFRVRILGIPATTACV